MPSTDAVTQMLAAELPLLDPQAEANLLKRAAVGRAARARLADRDLSRTRRALLVDLAADGQAATEHLIRANLRLVATVAHRFAGRADVGDLVGDGIRGLLTAVDSFDPARGVRFSTYAMWPITKAVSLAGAAAGPVSLPQGVHELRMRAANIADELTVELGREPTPDEVADALQVDPDRLALATRPLTSTPLHVDDADRPARDVVDPAASPDEQVVADETAAHVRRVLGGLPDGHARLLARRFGLDGRRPATLTQAADEFGSDPTSVWALERRLLAQLHGRLLASATGDRR